MKVQRPTNNSITGNYTSTHRAYDFAGLNLPDEVRAGMDGTVVETTNLYNTNWINTGVLTIRDYGNYIKVKHDDGTIELHCHLKKDSMLMIGTRVKAGQIIARIGNTGNSTGPHLHSEFRTAQNVNTPVEFVTSTLDPLTECLNQHLVLVKKTEEQDKKIKELEATEKRLKEEKDLLRVEYEGKLKVERDRFATQRVTLLKEFREKAINKLQEIA